MANVQNNYREQIIALFKKAENKIQVSMAWATDEHMINVLTEMATQIKIELLLSANYVNASKFPELVALQEAGATVVKTGTVTSGIPGFMHSKMVIIDEKEVYGGSYNLTMTARSNYENFDQYPSSRVSYWVGEFKKWISDATDYKVGFENHEELVQAAYEKMKAEQEWNKNYIQRIGERNRKFFERSESEEEILLKDEVRKMELRKAAIALQKQELKVASNGKTSTQQGAVVPKHRNYGGSLRTTFSGQKLSNSFSYAILHKREIEAKFPFLRCRVENDTLICRGTFQPENCNAYDVRIEFRAGLFPQVYILSPEIKPNADIHIYSEGSLCLFYPGDMKWKDTTSIADYTIPWIVEWIVVYELYLLTGKWEADFVPHGNVNAICESRNTHRIAC